MVKRIIICLFTKTTSSINLNNLWFIYQLRRQNKVSDSSSIFVIQLYNKLMLSLVATNLRMWRHARNWQSCQVVSFMKNLFLEDELKYFFFGFYWDVCLFTLVKPIIMEGVVFTLNMYCWFSLRTTTANIYLYLEFWSPDHSFWLNLWYKN